MALIWEHDRVGSVFNRSIEGSTYTRKSIARGIVATNPVAQYKEVIDDAGFIAFDTVLDATRFPLYRCTGQRFDSLQCLKGSTAALLTFTYRSFSVGFSTDPDDDGPVVVTTRDTTLVRDRTNQDKDGTIVTVTHEGDTQTPVMETDRPISTISCFRVEANEPRDRSDTHTGSVNSSLWNGYAARTVRCDGIRSEYNSGLEGYETEYRFTYRSDTWDEYVWYTDEAGKAPQGLVVDVGYKRVRKLAETNFGLLNITL